MNGVAKDKNRTFLDICFCSHHPWDNCAIGIKHFFIWFCCQRLRVPVPQTRSSGLHSVHPGNCQLVQTMRDLKEYEKLHLSNFQRNNQKLKRLLPTCTFISLRTTKNVNHIWPKPVSFTFFCSLIFEVVIPAIQFLFVILYHELINCQIKLSYVPL